MPYPVAKLPYGLRRRLGELATPNERYSLQIAAGNAAICPPKLQPIKKVSKHLVFFWRNGAISVVTERLKNNSFEITSFVFNEDSLAYASKTRVSFIGFDFHSVSSDTFGNFLLRPSWLTLNGCTLSKPFLDKLSKFTSGSVKMLSIDNKDCSENLSGGILDKLNAFPLLEFLAIRYIFLTPSWISDILKSRPQKLMTILVQVPHEQFHAFDYDELITLLRTQPRGFYMSIDIRWTGACKCLNKFFDGLKSHLDQRLISCPYDRGDNDDFDDWFYGDTDDDDYYDNDDDVDDNNDNANLDEHTKFEMHYNGETCCWYLPTDQADVSSKKRTISSESSDDSVLPVCKKQKTTNDCT